MVETHVMSEPEARGPEELNGPFSDGYQPFPTVSPFGKESRIKDLGEGRPNTV
jgi:hypothetical protein